MEAMLRSQRRLEDVMGIGVGDIVLPCYGTWCLVGV